MASWQNSSSRENHKSVFENVSHDRCIFCGGTEQKLLEQTLQFIFQNLNIVQAAFANLVIMANAKQVKAV